MTITETNLNPEQMRTVVSCAAVVGACRELMVHMMEEAGAKSPGAREWARRFANKLGVKPDDLPEKDAMPQDIALWSIRPLWTVMTHQDEERMHQRLRHALRLDRLFKDRSLAGVIALGCGFKWPWVTYPALLRLVLAPEDHDLAQAWLDAAGIPKMLEPISEGRPLPAGAMPVSNAVHALGVVIAGLRERERAADRRAGRAEATKADAVAKADRLQALLNAERRARAEEQATRRRPEPEPSAPALVPCPSCAALSERVDALEREAESLRHEAAEAARRAEEAESGAALAVEAMREALAQAWVEPEQAEGIAPAGERRTLAGLRVAVVGDPGRREDYRRLVEEAGAEFLFQDGCGGEVRAEERLAAADGIVALCDWLNHKMFAHLRRLEKCRGVPVAYCPTTGLASARRGLERLAEAAGPRCTGVA